MGHYDFYPNGGKKQEGCRYVHGEGCSHKRAAHLYADSIGHTNTTNYFISRKCGSWENWDEKNRCRSNCQLRMGEVLSEDVES